MRDHRKLRAFELADELVLEIYRITGCFPKEELYGLTSQMRRASISVASNIVEGCSRNGETEYIRFLEISFGSLKELHYQFTIAVRMAYVPPDEVTRLEEKFIEAEKVLSSLIRQLRKLYPKT